MSKIEAPICTLNDIADHSGMSMTDEAYLTGYLSRFAAPKWDTPDGKPPAEDGFAIGKQQCLKCSERLTGMFGSFQWGLCHGEGTCSKCGWPTRLYHFLKLEGQEEQRLVVMLQYHPSQVTTRSKKAPVEDAEVVNG